MENIKFIEKKIIKLIPPIIKKINRDTVINNFGKLCDQLGNNKQNHLINFIQTELRLICNINPERQLYIRGNYSGKQLSDLYMKYIMKYVKCDNCFDINTNLIKKNKINYKCCNKCDSMIAL